MDTSIIIMSIVIVGLIAIPVLLLENTKKKGKRLLTTIQDRARKNNNKITEYDKWNSYVIGIDMNSRKLYYASNIKNDEQNLEIDLALVQNCKISNIRKSKNSKTEEERLVLEFSFTDKKYPNATIEFYNSEIDGLTMQGEYQLAEKWLHIINK
ncbi:MAG: hypothetical protein A2X13_14335 [Bacteroidetes bacterium GWC2_33_15]|nr:MAG: hypothetical protein A2X10_12380 [Bacteroidetes bacterium GWA2_33_15]OFX50052.1 MAG: hypothetical protein A2X13_14335 [Bacteroidetes bacterium GWC2_33_15]OFX65205.1 MAG: hypothetical protein A2X15_03910 [Bacteroidetes bacterium GWB2_32_14]OFX70431.1 MAG: hypothetical protein A2X14_03965 [Bacteroidetes bacterium GWD2_33_33]HAN19699.1 hypothetical protein [Bacteroidales bacterium]